MYEKREYRNRFYAENLVFFRVIEKETDLMIGAKSNLANEALKAVKNCRKQLERYIKVHEEFKTSLKPVNLKNNPRHIICRMCEAAKKAGVGPMAAVAGAISEKVGMELLNYSDEVIVENGGDIFIKTNVSRKVGIHAGQSPLNEKIAIQILPEKTPLGICTSSGTVGHSLSFGKADAVVVVSKDTSLADAAATSLCNTIKCEDDIDTAIRKASKIEDISGIVAVMGDKFGAWGDIKLTEF